MTSSQWYLYLLECHDRTLYLGMTQDVPVRVLQHWRGHGGRYTRSRGVAAVVGVMEAGPSRADAAKQERRFKRLSSVDKRAAFCDQARLKSLSLPNWHFRSVDGRDACWLPPKLFLSGGEASTGSLSPILSRLRACTATCLVSVEIEETLGGGEVPSIAQWTSWVRLLRQVSNTLEHRE